MGGGGGREEEGGGRWEMVIHGCMMDDPSFLVNLCLEDRNLSKIYRTSIAGMSLLACKVKSAGCFLGCVCGSLLNVR